MALLLTGAALTVGALVHTVHAQTCSTTYSSGSPPPQALTIGASGTYCFDAGTYDTQITVTASNVEITGAPGTTASTVIIEPDSVTANAMNPDVGGSSITTVPAIIYVGSGEIGVDIEGVTVDGSGASSSVASLNPCLPVGSNGPDYGCFFGIVYWGSSGEISGVTITNINAYPSSTLPEGDGVGVGAPSGGSSSVTISGNTVSDYAKNGIDCEDASTTCTISSNQVSPLASAEAYDASYGIYLGPGSDGSVSGNTVTGNACTASACGSNLITQLQGLGIATHGTVTSVSIASNDLSGDDVGILLSHDSVTITPTSNAISGSTFVGLVVYDESQSVSGNSFSSEPVGVEAVSDSSSSPAILTLGSNTFSSVTTMFATQTSDGGRAEVVPTLTTSLSETVITVDASVTDSATLAGTTSGAGGTVAYDYYPDGTCFGTPTEVGPAVTVTSGTVPPSTLQQFTSAGSFSWDAVYSGDANNNGAVSPCEPLTVNKASPTISTHLASSTISVGGSAMDTATLSGASTGAGGTVTYYFFSGGSCSGTSTQVGSVSVADGIVPGSASEQFAATGTFSWDAVYSGDANNNGATSSCEALTVNPASVTVATTLSASTVVVGGTVTDQATLLGATASAGGEVSYYYFAGGSCSGSGSLVGTAVPVSSGMAPSSSAQEFTSPGTYGWEAVYSGDANNGGSTSPCEVLTVVRASPTLSPSLSPSASATGQEVTDSVSLIGGFQAGGTVTYEYFSGDSCSGSATAVGSPVAVSDGIAASSTPQVFTIAGSYSWNAVYSGDSNNNGATGPCQFLPVNEVGVSISSTLSATTVAYGASVTDSASLAGETSSAGGTVTYSFYAGGYCAGSASIVGSPVQVEDGVVPVSTSQAFSTPGSYSWNAVYSGDSNDNGATSPCESLLVTGLAETTLTIACTSTTVGVGATDQCTASVQTFDSKMTGSVAWSASGSGLLSSTTCGLPSTPAFFVTGTGSYYVGACSVKFTPTTAGTSVTLTANYAGDATDSPSQGSLRLTVTLRSTKTTLVCLPKTLTAGSVATITCTASVTGYMPTGTVEWTQSGTGSVTFSAPACTLVSGECSATAAATTAGSIKLAAGYEGDSNNGLSSKAVVVSVTKAPTSVAVSCTPTSLKLGSSVTCTAVVSGSYSPHSGYIVWTKTSGGGKIRLSSQTCTLSSGSCQVTAAVTSSGRFTLKAMYSGDQNNMRSWASTAVKASPSISPTLSTTALKAGGSVDDSAQLVGGLQAGGTITYEYFIGDTCSGAATVVGLTQSVNMGVVPSSATQIFVTVGSYSWEAVYSGDANNNGATGPCQLLAVNPVGVSVSLSLSSSTITFGSSATGTATLVGASQTAAGTVTYEYFSGSYCSGTATAVGSPAYVYDGLVSPSLPEVFGAPGAYSWNAIYSGDQLNNGATSQCVALSVKGVPVLTIALSASSITEGGSAFASAALTGVTSTAGGIVTYEYYSGSACSGTPYVIGVPVIVSLGTVPDSASLQFSAAGTYSWNAVYSGDTFNGGATSGCVQLTVSPPGQAADNPSYLALYLAISGVCAVMLVAFERPSGPLHAEAS